MQLGKIKDWHAVLVADRKTSHANASLTDRDLELVEDQYFSELSNGLRFLCKEVIHCDSPRALIEALPLPEPSFVLSVWSGQCSRNRRALVPSICEAYGLRYIGADTYTNIIAQDKAMSKQMFKGIGLSTPSWALIDRLEDLPGIDTLGLPLVVKPNLEGGSIGISTHNLVDSYEAARNLARQLLASFEQPILVEEFMPGREVCISILGQPNNIMFTEATEVFFADKPTALVNSLWGYETKKATTLRMAHRLITYEMPAQALYIAKRLFTALDKVEILRIDGRLSDSGFHAIELTPDIHLGSRASFAQAFRAKGVSYTDMLEMIISNSLARD